MSDPKAAAKKYIMEKAEKLIQEATAEGVVLTIELKPLQPLAMGNHQMVPEVTTGHPY